MRKPSISIKKLMAGEDRKVEDMVAELESARNAMEPALLWTERLSASTKGGKCLVA